jgi:hypothetical protein
VGDLKQHDGRWQGCGDGARIRRIFDRRTLRLLRKVIMPTANSASEVVTAALLVIGGKTLSGRTKDQNIGYIAEYLTALDIDLREVRIVGDEERAIVDALTGLRHRYSYSHHFKRKVCADEKSRKGPLPRTLVRGVA